MLKNFVGFVRRASKVCFGQNVKALAKRCGQICPLEINTFTFNAPMSTNEISMFKLAIEVCFKKHFEFIHVIFLSLGLTISVYFFGTPGSSYE